MTNRRHNLIEEKFFIYLLLTTFVLYFSILTNITYIVFCNFNNRNQYTDCIETLAYKTNLL